MTSRIVHVVNGSHAAQNVSVALRRLTGLRGKVVVHHDDLAVGSLVGIDDDRFARLPVWSALLDDFPGPSSSEAMMRRKMDADAEMLAWLARASRVAIWSGSSPSDRLMRARVVGHLEGKDVTIFDIDVERGIGRRSARPDGLVTTGLASRDELLRATTHGEFLGKEAIAAIAASWRTYRASAAPLRIVREGRIVDLSEEEVDARILAAIGEGSFTEMQAMRRAMAHYTGVFASDVFVASRIARLVRAGALHLAR